MVAPHVCFRLPRGWYAWVLLLVYGVVAGCGGTEPSGQAAEPFEDFWPRFFQDRPFQMSRIIFPLPERLPDEIEWAAADSLAEGKELIRYWHPANWPHLEPPEPPSDSLRHVVERTDTTYRLRVGIPDADAFAEMRFRRIEGRWYLIYFFNHL